jgi:hypothetical protein
VPARLSQIAGGLMAGVLTGAEHRESPARRTEGTGTRGEALPDSNVGLDLTTRLERVRRHRRTSTNPIAATTPRAFLAGEGAAGHPACVGRHRAPGASIVSARIRGLPHALSLNLVGRRRAPWGDERCEGSSEKVFHVEQALVRVGLKQ